MDEHGGTVFYLDGRYYHLADAGRLAVEARVVLRPRLGWRRLVPAPVRAALWPHGNPVHYSDKARLIALIRDRLDATEAGYLFGRAADPHDPLQTRDIAQAAITAAFRADPTPH